jgi:hypothetical protein
MLLTIFLVSYLDACAIVDTSEFLAPLRVSEFLTFHTHSQVKTYTAKKIPCTVIIACNYMAISRNIYKSYKSRVVSNKYCDKCLINLRAT